MKNRTKKKTLILLGLMVAVTGIVLSFLNLQYHEYLNEPKIIESPLTSEINMNPDEKEVLRVVFNKPIQLSDISYQVSPSTSSINATIRQSYLYFGEHAFTNKYPAFVLTNKGLPEGKTYIFTVQLKGFNI